MTIQQVADRDRAKGLTDSRGALLRMKRPVQFHLHTSASPRVFNERNGTPRVAMDGHVTQKVVPIPPYTPRKYAAEQFLPRNLVDEEEEDGPKPLPSHSVFARPNRSVA